MKTSRRRVSSLLDRVDAMTPQLTLLVATLLGLVVVLLDVLTGSEISFSIFYVAPIALVAWRLGRVPALVAAVVAAGAWYVVELIGDREYSQALIPLWNGIVRLGFFTIITQLLVVLRALLDQQSANARIDELTGLYNRRGFVERAEVEVARAARTKRPLTIAYLDLDQFKQLNDTEGHAAGDEVLNAVGSTSRALVRHVDVIGRVGGDEFVVLLPETSSTDAHTIIERLRTGLSHIGDDFDIGFSIGVVTFDPPPADVDTALRRADELMYAVKSEGRGAVRYETEPEPVGSVAPAES